MKYLSSDIHLIEKFSSEMGAVFSIHDLSVLFQSEGKQLYDRIRYLIDARFIKKVIRGVYASKGWDIKTVARRINPNGYITGPTVLAKELMIGTIPENKLYMVKTGAPRSYAFEGKSIKCNSMSSALFFGYTVEGGIKFACAEKALLDTLYLYQSGEKYFFNIFTDVNVSRINKEKFFEYLDRFPNSKFRRFAGDYLIERYYKNFNLFCRKLN